MLYLFGRNIVEAVKLTLVYEILTRQKIKSRKWMVGVCYGILIIVSWISEMISQNSIVGSVIRNTLFFCLIWFCFDGLNKKKIYYILAAEVIVDLVDTFVLILLSIFLHIDIEQLLNSHTNNFFINCISIIVYTVILILKKYINLEKKSTSVLNYIILILVTIASIGTIGGAAVLLEGYKTEELWKLYITSTTICSLCAMFLCVWQMVLQSSRDYYKKLNQLQQQFYDMQKSYDKTVEEKEREFQAFRHDFRYHIMMLEQLTLEDDVAQVRNYIYEMKQTNNSFDKVMFTGNSVMDSIITGLLEEKNISREIINVEGILPRTLPCNMYDLSTVLSNVIRNALEACERVEEQQKREILIEITYYKKNVIVLIKNTFNGKLLWKDGIPVSVKKDKWNQGYGINNIKNAIQKIKGDIRFFEEEGYFCVEIILLMA